MFADVKRLTIVYFLLLALFTSALVISAFIPAHQLSRGIGASLETLKDEGIYPSFGLPWRKVVLDNFTDSLMLNTAYSVDSQRPLWSMMKNLRFAESMEEINQITNLDMGYHGTTELKVGYERYWHGYLTYLRPLLSVFSYSNIRHIIFLALYAGYALLMYLLYKHVGIKIAIALTVGLFFVDFFYIWKSMQFSSVFLIGIYSSIFYLLSMKRKTVIHTPALFFTVGGLTAFFDLLTAPLVSLGFLLILSSQLNKKVSLQSVITNSALWATGYLSLWTGKWVFADILFVPGAIGTSIDQIVNRTVTQADSDFSHIRTLQLNVMQLIGYDRKNQILILILASATALSLVRYITLSREKILKMTPLFLIAAIPYAWYLVAANHSYLHVWYTYRAQMMTVVAGSLLIFECVDWDRMKRSLAIKSPSNRSKH